MKHLLLFGLLLLLGARLAAQSISSPSSLDRTITIPSSAYDIQFSITWACDDYPQNSAPGRIELLSGSTLIGRVIASNYRDSGASVTVSGPGNVDGVSSWVNVSAPNGTPADGFLSGTWHLTGLVPGTYTIRAWNYTTYDRLLHASTVWTSTSFDGGSTPAPANQPPTVTLLTPGDQTVSAGTPLTITGHATDPDGNLTNHNLDVQRPDGAWSFEAGFATGEPYQGGPVGSATDSTRSASFTFTDVGTYHVRSAASDGSGWYQSATASITVVAPPPAQYALVTLAGAGGAVTAGGTYDAGSSVAVSATPDGAHDFAGWSGDAGGAANPLSLFMDRAKSVQANFSPKSFSLVTSASSGGSVTPGGSYPYGATVTITAAADATHRFTGWAGDASGSAPSIALILTRTLSAQALFELKTAQTITFPAISDQNVGAGIPLSVTSSSGLPVALAVSGPATYAGGILTLTGPGTVTIQATQDGDGNYLPANPVTRSFNATAAVVVRYRTAGHTFLQVGRTPESIPYVIQPNP